MEREVAIFIKENAIELLLSLGIIFRTFFATRRLGGFLIAFSFAFYLLYPSFVLIFPLPLNTTNATISFVANYTNNTAYAPVPIIDLNSNYALAQKIDIMTGRCLGRDVNSSCPAAEGNFSDSVDFISDTTMVVQRLEEANAKLFLFVVLAHLTSLVISIIFIWEVSKLLGGELVSGVVRSV